MIQKQPNHICKNANCPHGVDGKPKHYYACNYCDKINQWRSVACCPECYDAYMKQIVEARSKNKKIDLLPNRTDKSKDEVKELLNQPVEQFLEETKKELAEYFDKNTSIAEAVEKINEDIDKHNPSRNRKKNNGYKKQNFINSEVNSER